MASATDGAVLHNVQRCAYAGVMDIENNAHVEWCAGGHSMTIQPIDDWAWTDRLQVECECGGSFELGPSPSLTEVLLAARRHVEDSGR